MSPDPMYPHGGRSTRALLVLFGLLLLFALVPDPAISGGCICQREPAEPGDPDNPPAPPPPPPPPPPPNDPSDPTRPGPHPPVDPPPPPPPAEDPPTTPTDDPAEDPDPPEPEPDKPTTPPEDDAGQPPTPAAPAPKQGSAPTTGAPTTGPTPRGPGVSEGRRRRPAPKKSGVMSTWRGWWAVNDRALLPERSEGLLAATPSPEDEALVAGRRQRRELAVRREILPAIRDILQPDAKVNDLLRRASLLALGKIAQTEEDTALLVHWLANDGATPEVRDAAALGIGLLCRSDEARQFQPWVLDALRNRLVRVAGDRDAPEEVRATCAIALGLLGAQPFGEGIHRDGRLITQQIWRGLQPKNPRLDVTVAMLTALGMQPPGGVPSGVRDSLTDAIWGRTIHGRRFSDMERSHALTALARLGGPGSITVPLRVLQADRMPNVVRRAAIIAVGHVATNLSPDERKEAAAVLRRAIPRARDPLSRGLAFIAVGRLVSAHVCANDPLVRDLQSLWHLLVAEARTGTGTSRGFAALGLGLAARRAHDDDATPAPLRRVHEEAEKVLLQAIDGRGSDADTRAAYATALGIMGARSAVPVLVRLVEDRHAVSLLRADAAVALGHIGHAGPEVIRALHVALAETQRPRVQSGAALGLSILRGPSAGRRLLRELEHSPRQADVVRLTEPLGHLGDPALARPLVEYAASSKNADYSRALMVVALGNLGDPERRPSLARLGRDANYPDAPPALRDTLFTR